MRPGNHRRGIIFAAPTHQIMRVIFIVWGLVAASVGGAATITEDFSADPLQNGWQIFGDPNLFQWDSTNQNLAVTWDSSQTNSYFYKPLGTILAKSDDFSLSFDLQLNDIAWSGSAELSVGLISFLRRDKCGFFPAGRQHAESFRVRLFSRQRRRSTRHRCHFDRHECEFRA